MSSFAQMAFFQIRPPVPRFSAFLRVATRFHFPFRTLSLCPAGVKAFAFLPERAGLPFLTSILPSCFLFAARLLYDVNLPETTCREWPLYRSISSRIPITFIFAIGVHATVCTANDFKRSYLYILLFPSRCCTPAAPYVFFLYPDSPEIYLCDFTSRFFKTYAPPNLVVTFWLRNTAKTFRR